ncbi:cystatin-like [Rhinoraja longicauda]
MESLTLRVAHRSLLDPPLTVVVPCNVSEGSGDRDKVPGIPRNISVDDPGVQSGALAAVYRYNNASNDIYLFKVQRILNAQVQIVSGLKYLLHFDIGRTVCRKENPYNFKHCSFQTSPSLIKDTSNPPRCPAVPEIPPRARGQRVVPLQHHPGTDVTPEKGQAAGSGRALFRLAP